MSNLTIPKSRARELRLSASRFKCSLALCSIALSLATTGSAIPLIGTDGASLIKFDSSTPGTITTVNVAPRQPGETLLAIDYRPATGELLAVTSQSRLLRINPTTGATTLVGSLSVNVSGTNFGMDVDPSTDRIRLVSDAEQNLRINPNDGATVADTALNPSGAIVASAYDRSYTRVVDDATPTTLFGIDASSRQLVRIGGPDGSPAANGGQVTVIGQLFPDELPSFDIGFDIAPDGVAYVTITPGETELHTVNLSTGAATFVGVVGNGATTLRGLTAEITAPLFVTNTNNSGAGSLRAAIMASNASAVDDIIKFNIAGNGPHIITLSTTLPVITDRVAIDGKSEPDFSTADQVPKIAVDGGTSVSTGLEVSGANAGGSTIQGLRVTRFATAGIEVSDAPTVVIRGNYVGTDGTAAQGGENGIAVTGLASAGTRVGGSGIGDRNVISGSSYNLYLETANVAVQGNYIGTNAAGSAALASVPASGVYVFGSSDIQIGGVTAGQRNVIGGLTHGVRVLDSTRVTVQGNFIGTNAAGTAAISNDIGVRLADEFFAPQPGTVDSVVGGTAEGAGNLISGNGIGVTVQKSSSNRIEGNIMGTDAQAFSPIPNGVAIELGVSATNNVVGGTGDSAGNNISRNVTGVRFAGSSDNFLQGNRISDNTGAGVELLGSSGGVTTQRNVIGSEGAGNFISQNDGPGVLVGYDGEARLNPIRFNGIVNNSGLAIDLAPGNERGITPNDPGDADTGPNDLQNFPVLTSATEVPSGVTVEGNLNSTPNSAFSVDFSLVGFGFESPLGMLSLSTDAEGNAPFTATFPATFIPGMFPSSGFAVKAIATSAAAASPGNTSEFSAPVGVGQAGGVRFTEAAYQANESAGNATITVERVDGTSGTLTVQYTAIDGSALAPGDYGATSGTLTFANGETSKTFSVTINDDAIDEENESIVLVLSNASAGATIESPGTASLTIVDNDLPTPTPTATPAPTATATPSPSPSAPPTVLGNIATRLAVETGENVLIGGFIITGTQPKKLIVRATGPSSGVEGALADPLLQMYDGLGVLFASNDNWEEAENKQEIIDSTVAPLHPREGAFLASLPPGSYTAVVSGVDGTTGIGVVEAYDLDRSVDSKLANIATRGMVKTDDDVMIGGLIVLGDTPQKVIIRAIGPSLPVEDALADPTLNLVNGEGESLAYNNNWRDEQETAIEETTIPPSDDLEAAIVATLPPAPYTAVVRGNAGGTGIALVEVYALD